MTGTDLLRLVVSELDAAGIPHMLTGSVAAAWHGGGRATMDIDLVIDPAPSQLDAFVRSVASAGVYVSPEAAREALALRSMFNVVDTNSGWKVDCIIRKARPFSEQEFARRRAVVHEGLRLWVATVEDLVVAKLEWAALGGSLRQLEDVGALLHVAGTDVDRAYVEHWVSDLGLMAQWREALRLAEPGPGGDQA